MIEAVCNIISLMKLNKRTSLSSRKSPVNLKNLVEDNVELMLVMRRYRGDQSPSQMPINTSVHVRRRNHSLGKRSVMGLENLVPLATSFAPL